MKRFISKYEERKKEIEYIRSQNKVVEYTIDEKIKLNLIGGELKPSGLNFLNIKSQKNLNNNINNILLDPFWD